MGRSPCRSFIDLQIRQALTGTTSDRYNKNAGQHQPSGIFKTNRSANKRKLNCALPFRVSSASTSFVVEVFTACHRSRKSEGLAVDLFKPLISAFRTEARSAGR